MLTTDSASAAVEFEPDIPLVGVATLRGWAVDRGDPGRTGSDAIRVLLYVDGRPLGPAEYGGSRPDVAAALGDPRFSSSGWSLPFDSAQLASGPHSFTALFLDGASDATETLQWSVASSHPPLIFYASIAVELFFVISGFLITTILVNAKGKPVYFFSFYSRRALRILPLASVVIVISYFVFGENRDLLPCYAFYYNNYCTFDTGRMMKGLEPMWSLAVEEHFYLVVPFICFTFPKRLIYLPVAVLGIASITFHLLHPIPIPGDYWTADDRTQARAFPIAFGALLALGQLGLVPRPRALIALLVAYVAALVALLGGTLAPLEAVVYPALVLLVHLVVSGRYTRSSRVLRFVGERSYSLYLLHVPVLVLTVDYLVRLPTWLGFAVFVLVVTAVAHLSYEYLEKPILSRRPTPESLSRMVRGGVSYLRPIAWIVSARPAGLAFAAVMRTRQARTRDTTGSGGT